MESKNKQTQNYAPIQSTVCPRNGSEILFFKVISDLKFSFSDPNFRSEICKFLSRSEIKNFRSENQLCKKKEFKILHRKTAGYGNSFIVFFQTELVNLSENTIL